MLRSSSVRDVNGADLHIRILLCYNRVSLALTVDCRWTSPEPLLEVRVEVVDPELVHLPLNLRLSACVDVVTSHGLELTSHNSRLNH